MPNRPFSHRLRDHLGLPFALLLLVLSGCRQEELGLRERAPLRLEDLSVPVSGGERSFFFTDRRGGMLTGKAGRDSGPSFTWSINGIEVVSSIGITVGGGAPGRSGDAALAVRVFPDRLVVGGAGWEMSVAPVEGVPGGGHAIGLSFTGLRGAGVAVSFAEGRSGAIAVGCGRGGIVEGTRVRCAGVDSMEIVAVTGLKGASVAEIAADLSESFRLRRARMESVLERSYLHCSDLRLTRAIAWLRLSIDALVVETGGPSVAGAVPWDGSFDARENLRSFSGIQLALGDPAFSGRMLEAWGARMDGRPASATYGRIAGRVRGGVPEFGAIDAGGWFARALYDYVIASGDTSRSVRLFPVLQAGVAGMEKNNLGADTLIHHRAEETWTSADRFRGAAGPFTAVEIQSLWQTQQTIACIIAQSMHDTTAAKMLARGAVDASMRFTSVFIDTARQVLYDFVDRQGRAADAAGASAMLALESLEGDRLMSSLLKRSVALLTPYGPRTQDGGPVATWLTGPFAYALSRSDRQDIAGVITGNLARYALEEGMVGTLPGGFAVSSDGRIGARPEPSAASLSGMAEFLRLVYQDYLGVRIDAPSLVIRFEPKLPPGLDSADFTLQLGTSPVRGIYVRGEETSRMTVQVGEVPRAVKWRFLWLFENGDGWMGAARVAPGGTLTAVFGPEEMFLYSGDEEVQPEEKWFIRGLSRRPDFAGLAIPGTRP